MKEQYDILYDGCVVGKANIIRDGLYYRICCCCKQPGSDMYRIKIICENLQLDLGICIPENDSLILNKRIPSKTICSGSMEFYLTQHNCIAKGKKIPVSQDVKFVHLSMLKYARWYSDGMEHGVWIEK